MSCRHGWHDCGPWYGPPWGSGPYGPPEWYGTADWYDEADRPIRRRYRRAGRPERGAAPADLEARLVELREELRRIEVELSALGAAEDEPS